MCEVFLGGDAAMFEKKSRSIRIEGHVTSVCIEMVFWRILDHIAEEQNTKLSQFVSDLYNEALIKMGDVTNLSSVLRVSCINYLSHQQSLAPENAMGSLRHLQPASAGA